MTQTKPFEKYFRGLNLLIEPKAITKPKGKAKTRVSTNISRVFEKPSKRLCVTFQNIFYITFLLINLKESPKDRRRFALCLLFSLVYLLVSHVKLVLVSECLK